MESDPLRQKSKAKSERNTSPYLHEAQYPLIQYISNHLPDAMICQNQQQWERVLQSSKNNALNSRKFSSDITNESNDPFATDVHPTNLEMIKEGQYSRNRVYLYGWVRRECEKFKLQFETYANAVALMDEYYKYLPFDKDHFVMTALCLIIASSKAFEPKVLYTSAVAGVNKFNYDQMLKLEINILAFLNSTEFDHKINQTSPFTSQARRKRTKFDDSGQEWDINDDIFIEDHQLKEEIKTINYFEQCQAYYDFYNTRIR